MSGRNIVREIAEQCGIELLPMSEWTDEQKIRHDVLVYGTAFARRRPDGSLEHIPTPEVLVYQREATMTAEELLERLCDPANTQERYEITPYMDLPAIIRGAGEALKSHPPVEIHRRLCIAIECAAKLLAFSGACPGKPVSITLAPSEVQALRKFLDDHDMDYACGDGPIASAAALDAIERILEAAERKP